MTILTLRCRLEVDLWVRHEGKELLWHPQAHFLDSHLSPTSLAAGRGVPREQTGPTGEQEVSAHCRTGDVLCHTRVSKATKAHAEDVSLGLSSPRSQQDSPKPG